MLPAASHVVAILLDLSHTRENEVMVDCPGSETDAPSKVQVRAVIGVRGESDAVSRQVN
jgi:hypothetical protein